MSKKNICDEEDCNQLLITRNEERNSVEQKRSITAQRTSMRKEEILERGSLTFTSSVEAARIIRASRICIRRGKLFECRSRNLVEGVQGIKSTKMTKVTSSNDEASEQKDKVSILWIIISVST